MKMLQSLLATLLVVASFIVTSSSIQINMSTYLWCGKFCKTPYFGDCQPVCSKTNLRMTCQAQSCEQTCYLEGCLLECHGKSCKQFCPKGNCLLRCPKDAKICDQECGQLNNCKKEYLQPPKPSTHAPTTEATTTQALTTEATTTQAPTTEATTTQAPTTEATTTQAPTTAATTTEATTTQAPTTEATTTQAPTTEAPTTAAADECDTLGDGVCTQFCSGGGCTMECFDSPYYHSCEQYCTSGCNMTCSAPTKCASFCLGGNCQKVICKADTCEQTCTFGGCGLECHGQTCEQECNDGNCELQCPSDANTCDQLCSSNTDKCSIEYA